MGIRIDEGEVAGGGPPGGGGGRGGAFIGAAAVVGRGGRLREGHQQESPMEAAREG